MARIIIKEEKAPYKLKEGDSQFICMCGLAANQPFCDGTHKISRDEEEGKLYRYENGERKEADLK